MVLVTARQLIATVGVTLFVLGQAHAAVAGDKAEPDAWTKIENEQIGLAVSQMLNDDSEGELRAAAQKRYGYDDHKGELFMECMVGLSGHPDFTAARVHEGLDICSRLTPASRH